MDIIQEFAQLRRKDWATHFNSLRETNSLRDAAMTLWDEFNVEGNPYLLVLTSPEALLFSILTYIPNRAEGERIGSPPGTLIEWDSAPVYDTVSNYWNNIDGWNCTDWKNWHIKLEQHYGDTYTANAVWESAWLHEDNHCLVAAVLFCPQTDHCRYDCDFVEYLASKDIGIGNLVSNVYCDLTNIVLNIVRTAVNVTQTAVTISETTKQAVPLVAIALLGAGAYQLTK